MFIDLCCFVSAKDVGLYAAADSTTDIVSAIGNIVAMCFTGELTVFCDGPDTDRPAECYRTDNSGQSNSGQSVVTITAHSAGLHSLHVRYNDVNVPGKRPKTLYIIYYNDIQYSNVSQVFNI